MKNKILLALKAIEVTGDTVLFVDSNQINLKVMNELANLRGCLVVTVKGPPNISAMTRVQLKEILDKMS